MYRIRRVEIILINVGFILSAVACIYVVGQYFTLSKSEVSALAFDPERDIALESLEKLPRDATSTDIILDELRARNRQLVTMHSSMLVLIETNKTQLTHDIYLVLSIAAIFLLLAVIGMKRRDKT